jgi:hypothetical protein
MTSTGHTVSEQTPWLHWQAISTSFRPACLQALPQNLSPGCAVHRHGMCAHFVTGFVAVLVAMVVILFAFFVLNPSQNQCRDLRPFRTGSRELPTLKVSDARAEKTEQN